MEVRAKLLGHPIHQMLVALPLGLLSGAVAFDAIQLLPDGLRWGGAAVSYWLIPPGVLTGLLAAVFGLLDWLLIPKGTRARQVGAVHGLGNVAVVALFSVSWLLRESAAVAPSLPALLLSYAGGGLAMVTGWLGGELVDRMGVGVDDGANLDSPSSLSGKPAGGLTRSPTRAV